MPDPNPPDGAPQPEPMLLDTAAVAALLGVHTRTVERLRASGRMPRPIKLGTKAVRWDRRDIQLWIDLRCPPTVEFEARKESAERRKRS